MPITTYGLVGIQWLLTCMLVVSVFSSGNNVSLVQSCEMSVILKVYKVCTLIKCVDPHIINISLVG